MFDPCICIDVAECATLLSDTRPRAAKTHSCVECKGEIIKGTRYQRHRTVCEDEFADYVTCLPCADTRSSVMTCDFIYGGLWEHVHEAYCDDEFCLCPERQGVKRNTKP